MTTALAIISARNDLSTAELALCHGNPVDVVDLLDALRLVRGAVVGLPRAAELDSVDDLAMCATLTRKALRLSAYAKRRIAIMRALAA